MKENKIKEYNLQGLLIDLQNYILKNGNKEIVESKIVVVEDSWKDKKNNILTSFKVFEIKPLSQILSTSEYQKSNNF